MKQLVISWLFILYIGVGSYSTNFPCKPPDPPELGDYGAPLYLTTYIEMNQLYLAQVMSRVDSLPDAPCIASYSGYLTVNNDFDSNLFFWFFPPLNNNVSAPILLWLQGGPGFSSMLGLFVENGPFVLTSGLKATLREYTWNKNFGLLYIDSPVESGFSFTRYRAGYARNMNDVTRDLYEALKQFFTIFYQYRRNDFYITGQSYAGKYIPALAYKIHTEGSNINLKGIAIGGGFSDPEMQIDYGNFLYNHDLVDEMQRQHLQQESDEIKKYIKEEKWYAATEAFYSLLRNIKTITGYKLLYNLQYKYEPEDYHYYKSYLEQPAVRKAIHVGDRKFHGTYSASQYLSEDIMQSVKPWVATIMDNYKVMIYNGVDDIVTAAPLVQNYVESIPWKYLQEVKSTSSFLWEVLPTDETFAGYVREVKDFRFVLVESAGHQLPYDRPREAFDMIQRFVSGRSFGT